MATAIRSNEPPRALGRFFPFRGQLKPPNRIFEFDSCVEVIAMR